VTLITDTAIRKPKKLMVYSPASPRSISNAGMQHPLRRESPFESEDLYGTQQIHSLPYSLV
jgi:hypothetical protein